MARQRISEFRAKSLLFDSLGLPYSGIQVSTAEDISSQLVSLDFEKKYIVKVDQGVKKRMKRGLIALNVSVDAIPDVITSLKDKGFTQFLVEPMASYNRDQEKYFALERQKNGYFVTVSPHGGIEIEEHSDSLISVTLPYTGSNEQAKQQIQEVIGLESETLENILQAFDKYYVSFLEINPFVIHGSQLLILDLAVEVDSVAEFFVDKGWTRADFTAGEKQRKTEEERIVELLNDQSQAAFTLDVLNPHGSVFMLLSGGGASLVLADEVANLGFGTSLANYGEYSGNPNAEETYHYTKQVLSLLLRSQAPKKVLIIGGGVANFTDIKATFKGVIRALSERAEELRQQGVKVFVRRGGPNQKEGLKHMRDFLDKEALLGRVVGPDVVLTDIVNDAVATIS